MKRIFIGGVEVCSVHNEKNYLKRLILKSSTVKLTNNYRKADIIVLLDTCAASYDNAINSINLIKTVLDSKKKDSSVIVSGCLANGLNCEIPDIYKEVLSQVNIVDSAEIINYIFENYLSDPSLTITQLNYSLDIFGTKIKVSPVSGCLNNCSFCKNNSILNFPLKSKDIDELKILASEMSKINEKSEFKNVIYANIFSSNLSLYGVDKYGVQRAHEAIDILTSPENIKYVTVGFLINWYPELLDCIILNKKIKRIYISLESGCERVYNLMNRPISLKNLETIIKTIKQERPDIQIITEIIAGFPTETLPDLKKSIKMIYELELYPEYVWDYFDSPTISSSKLPQHPRGYSEWISKWADRELLLLKDKLDKDIYNGERYVMYKDNRRRAYLTMLTNGVIDKVDFDQLDEEYNIGDFILPNSIKSKQLTKTRFLNRLF